MGLATTLKHYRRDIALSMDIYNIANATTIRGGFVHQVQHRGLLTQSAFLKIFISWETFLETSFKQYLLGNKSIINRTVRRYIKPINESHAISIPIGINTYFDWSRPDVVIKVSKLFFNAGEPYNSVISSIQSDIFDMKTIRNAAAHLSSTTSASLDALTSRLLGSPHSNVKPHDLLVSTLPGSAPATTIFYNYIQILDAAAQQISEA